MSDQPAQVGGSRNQKVDELVAQFMEESRVALPMSRATNPLAARRRLVALLSLICAAAWLAPYPKAQPKAEIAPELVDASARMSLFLAAQRVRSYDSTNHRMPATLADAGVSDTTLVYVRDGRRFRIISSVASSAGAYDSAAPASLSLRGAETVIDRSSH